MDSSSICASVVEFGFEDDFFSLEGLENKIKDLSKEQDSERKLLHDLTEFNSFLVRHIQQLPTEIANALLSNIAQVLSANFNLLREQYAKRCSKFERGRPTEFVKVKKSDYQKVDEVWRRHAVDLQRESGCLFERITALGKLLLPEKNKSQSGTDRLLLALSRKEEALSQFLLSVANVSLTWRKNAPCDLLTESFWLQSTGVTCSWKDAEEAVRQ